MYQVLMFALTFCNYASLHATRSIWSSATHDIKDIYSLEDQSIANINMCFLLTYAIGGIFMGQLADKYPKRKLIFALYTIIATLVAILGLMSFIPDDRQ